jgi:N-dimethylarginine dimethylaminohydrolase
MEQGLMAGQTGTGPIYVVHKDAREVLIITEDPSTITVDVLKKRIMEKENITNYNAITLSANVLSTESLTLKPVDLDANKKPLSEFGVTHGTVITLSVQSCMVPKMIV